MKMERMNDLTNELLEVALTLDGGDDEFDLDDLDLDNFDLNDLVIEEDEDEDTEKEVKETEEEIENEELDDLELEEEDDEIIVEDIDEDDEEEIIEVKKPVKKVVKKEVTVKEEPKKVTTKKAEPVAKTKSTTTTTKKAPSIATKSTTVGKPIAKKASTTKANNNKVGISINFESEKFMDYQGMLDKIRKEKVDSYNEIMERRANGENIIPLSKRISKSDFARLMSLKMDESDAMQTLIIQILKKVNKDAIPKSMERKLYEIAKPSLTALSHLYQVLFADICYDLVKIESGLELINTPDCKFSFQGKLQAEKIVDNSQINNGESNATLLKEFIKVESSSRAPENIKVKGMLDEEGNFIPTEE
jgi:hypothetical protein